MSSEFDCYSQTRASAPCKVFFAHLIGQRPLAVYTTVTSSLHQNNPPWSWPLHYTHPITTLHQPNLKLTTTLHSPHHYTKPTHPEVDHYTTLTPPLNQTNPTSKEILKLEQQVGPPQLKATVNWITVWCLYSVVACLPHVSDNWNTPKNQQKDRHDQAPEKLENL